MTCNPALKSYPGTNAEATDHLKLVIMSYDTVISDLEEARNLHENRSTESTCNKIHHARDIITELLVGLDYEGGGEVAQNLSLLYDFMLRQLIGINNRQDTAMYDHLIHILAELRGAWEQVRRTARQMAAPAARSITRNWADSA
jgi:flagellar secretion chaperone FliS